ncbi:hypothetical protein D3C85_1219070 [compost metagenome]
MAPGIGTIARPIIGSPDWLNLVSMFSGPNSAPPTSLKRTILSPSVRTIILLNSSGLERLPTVFTVNSVLFPVSFPEGNSTFCALRALRTSATVQRYAVNFTGSIHRRIA